MRWGFWFAIATLITICYAAKPLDVKIAATFNAPSFSALIAESLYQEKKEGFIWYLNHLSDLLDAENTTEKELYINVVNSLKREYVLSDEELSSLQFSLGLFSGAPKLQAFSSIVQSRSCDCDTWLQLDEESQVCFSDLPKDSPLFSKLYSKNPLDYEVVKTSATGIPYAVVVTSFERDLIPFHELYYKLALEGKCNYVIRYSPPSSSKLNSKLYVKGFGTHVSLKRTDYLVVDDREFPREKGDNPASFTSSRNKRSNERLFGMTSDSLQSVTPEKIAILDLLATQSIASSTDMLTAFRELTQDFPIYAHYLSIQPDVSNDLIEELNQFQSQYVPEGINTIWLNGLSLDLEEMDAFSILSLIKKEKDMFDRFEALGIKSSKVLDIVTNEAFANEDSDFKFVKFHCQDDIEDWKAIHWVNEIESNPKYDNWPKSIQILLKPIYPGQLHMLGKQLHTVIYPIFPSSPSSLPLLSELIQFSRRPSPVQTGMVCAANDDDEFAQTVCKSFFYISKESGTDSALKFLYKCLNSDSSADLYSLLEEHLPLSEHDDDTLANLKKDLSSSFFDHYMSKSNSWVNRLGIDSSASEVIVNGRIISHDENYDRSMYGIFLEDIPEVQIAVAEGKISEDDNLLDFILRDASLTRNPLVYPSSKSSIKSIDIKRVLENVGSLNHEDILLIGSSNAKYSFWLVADFNEKEGLEILSLLADLLSENKDANLMLIQEGKNHVVPPLFAKLLSSPKRSSKHLQEILNSNLDPSSGVVNDMDKALKFLKKSKAVVKELGLTSECKSALLLNGRMICSFSVDSLNTADLKMLMQMEYDNYLSKLSNIAGSSRRLKNSRAISFLSSYLKTLESTPMSTSSPTKEEKLFPRDFIYNKLGVGNATFETGDFSKAYYQFVAVLDPLSKDSQKWSAILEAVSKLNGVGVRIHFNPKQTLSELPLTRFYRYSISAEPEFDALGHLEESYVEFDNLPADTLLTMDIEARDAWTVMQKDVDIDLFNIKLEHTSEAEASDSITAIYELKNILVQGYSQEEFRKSPPRGMQLKLGNLTNSHVTDTIVLSNLGYFQLKANPGVWTLEPMDGRSSQFYEILSLNKKNSYKDPQVIVDSFEGVTLNPVMRRKPGFESADIMDEDLSSHKFFDKIKKSLSFFNFKRKEASINIFSVASGHLYERFLYIMTKSVIEHTDKKVKFWFIENFLSPSFKSSIPAIAKKYNFEYEYITYNWPHWLRKQEEKQREIWGYKILFLDVLFPLELHKVIYVDADQIVRADLQELMDMDLHGAPYGYTPMCDSREEMEGFRFWKKGYWKKFLRGLKYHISALYVVDLDRFRKMGAGDLLRRQYQLLSADPNSLSNLDQDLPNHLQHLIPIYSLPQDWLWCETWCSDESLKTAKTIDLCQNPLTKEKKLDRARRQVSEWTSYDNEIASVLQTASSQSDKEFEEKDNNSSPDEL